MRGLKIALRILPSAEVSLVGTPGSSPPHAPTGWPRDSAWSVPSAVRTRVMVGRSAAAADARSSEELARAAVGERGGGASGGGGGDGGDTGGGAAARDGGGAVKTCKTSGEVFSGLYAGLCVTGSFC